MFAIIVIIFVPWASNRAKNWWIPKNTWKWVIVPVHWTIDNNNSCQIYIYISSAIKWGKLYSFESWDQTGIIVHPACPACGGEVIVEGGTQTSAQNPPLWKAGCRIQCGTLHCGRQDAEFSAEPSVVEGWILASVRNPLLWKAECRPQCGTLCCGGQDADLGAESSVVECRMQTSLWKPLLWKVGHRPQRGTLYCGRQGAALGEQPTAVQSQAKLTISFLNSLVCLRLQHRFAFAWGFCTFCLRTCTILLEFPTLFRR